MRIEREIKIAQQLKNWNNLVSQHKRELTQAQNAYEFFKTVPSPLVSLICEFEADDLYVRLEDLGTDSVKIYFGIEKDNNTKRAISKRVILRWRMDTQDLSLALTGSSLNPEEIREYVLQELTPNS